MPRSNASSVTKAPRLLWLHVWTMGSIPLVCDAELGLLSEQEASESAEIDNSPRPLRLRDAPRTGRTLLTVAL